MPEVTFLGHSCVSIKDGDHSIIIDPFLTVNPQATADVAKIDAKYILVTHGHGDHIGDAIFLSKQNKAPIIGTFELTHLCASQGCEIHPMHVGGGFNFPFGRVKLTIAHHGGGYGEDASRYTGPPVGFLITIGGKTIYHPGDTGLFLDMKLIGEMNEIDLAFLPIGDNFTMGIDDAAKAAEFLHAKKVVPFHYDTWEIIECDPHKFAEKVKGSEVVILDPGQSITI